jgi:hypothetical protein
MRLWRNVVECGLELAEGAVRILHQYLSHLEFSPEALLRRIQIICTRPHLLFDQRLCSTLDKGIEVPSPDPNDTATTDAMAP